MTENPSMHSMDELGTWVTIPREEPPMKNICVKIGDEGPDGSIIKNGVTFTYLQHGDCLEEAQSLAEMVKEKYGVKDVFIYYTGAVIGSHSGPGTLALFFLGSHR